MNPKDDRLAAATERMNQLFERVRGVFAARFASRASVPMGEGRELVFGKIGREWDLLILRPNTEVRSIAAVSRKDRLDALALLESLFYALENEEAGNADAIEVQCAAADTWLLRAGLQ